MDVIKIEQLDYKYILIENYKQFGLNEQELVILLLIDNAEKEAPSLITADQLVLKMSLEEKQIDELLVSLFDRNFLSYETVNGILVTSLKPTKNRIVEFVKNSFLNVSPSELLDDIDGDGKTVFKAFELKLNRSLTPMELDSIRGWFHDGINKDVIISALNEVSTKTKRITINAVDKMILKMISSSDIKKEGFSLVSEKNKKDIDEALEIASYNWVKND